MVAAQVADEILINSQIVMCQLKLKLNKLLLTSLSATSC